MKRTLQTFLAAYLLLFTIYVQAQTNPNCSNSMPNYLFQQKSREIQEARVETVKLQKAKALVDASCLSTSQVKIIANYFDNDFDRLEFAKTAYPKTTDQANFYDVYDAFAYFSTVFRLHDYVLQLKGNGNGNSLPLPTPTITFPNYDYPNTLNYTGQKFCAFPMQEGTFLAQAQQIQQQSIESNKLLQAVQLANAQCLSTAQIMKLASLLNADVNRLSLLQQTYDAAYDPGNFQAAEQVLRYSVQKTSFRTFLQGKANAGGGIGNGNNNGTYYGCQIADSDFAQIKTSINKQAFNNTKVNLAKQILNQKGRCFKSSQVKEIVALFNFESSKKDIAKYAYDYTTDQSNYFVVYEAFSFDSSKNELIEYIKNK